MTDADWNKMVEQQRAMHAGEQVIAAEGVKEEVKKNDRVGLFEVSQIDWAYFSPDNM